MRDVKSELQNIIYGNGQIGDQSQLREIQNFLRGYACSGQGSEKQERLKSEEEKLILTTEKFNFFYAPDIDESLFISEGAEQRVYRHDGYSVIKLNSGIFYESWLDYFNSILIHNYFFSSTSYEFLGFRFYNDSLVAVVKQDFIVSDEVTDLALLKKFMVHNTFSNVRNNDYESKLYGIILEDLHDENVLFKNGVFYFIDTVFYLRENF